MPTHQIGQWIAAKEQDGSIQIVYHIQNNSPFEAEIYKKDGSEQLHLMDQRQPILDKTMREVRVL